MADGGRRVSSQDDMSDQGSGMSDFRPIPSKPQDAAPPVAAKISASAGGVPRGVVRVHIADPLLPSFQSDYENPACHGYLAKYNGVNFHRRYIVQRGSSACAFACLPLVLLYYVDHTHPGKTRRCGTHVADPKGVFLLDECTLQKGARLATRQGFFAVFNNSRLATPHSLVLRRPSGMSWELCAGSDGDLETWIRAILATGVVRRLPDIRWDAPWLQDGPASADDGTLEGGAVPQPPERRTSSISSFKGADVRVRPPNRGSVSKQATVRGAPEDDFPEVSATVATAPP